VLESEVQRSMVTELTERLFQGDYGALVSHLIDEHEVDPAEVERLRKVVERRVLDARAGLGGASPGKVRKEGRRGR